MQNFVMSGRGGIIEIQATAEENPFSVELLSAMQDLAFNGIGQLVKLQRRAIADMG